MEESEPEAPRLLLSSARPGLKSRRQGIPGYKQDEIETRTQKGHARGRQAKRYAHEFSCVVLTRAQGH